MLPISILMKSNIIGTILVYIYVLYVFFGSS